MTTTRSQSQAMSTPQPTVAPQEPEGPSSTPFQESSQNTPSQASPESTSSQECPLSPGWVHAISSIMGYSLKSEIGQNSRNGYNTMILMIQSTSGSPGTPLIMKTSDYYKNILKVVKLWSISQAAQPRTSSVSGTT